MHQLCINQHVSIGPLQDPVTWYGINYTGTQMTQWDFQNKGTHNSPARLFFVLKVPLRHLRPSVIYSVPCDRILQRAYWLDPEYGVNNYCVFVHHRGQKSEQKLATKNFVEFHIYNHSPLLTVE